MIYIHCISTTKLSVSKRRRPLHVHSKTCQHTKVHVDEYFITASMIEFFSELQA